MKWPSMDIRKFETIHIPLWLLKDTCWMMEWRYLGITMIIPTVTIAIVILFLTKHVFDFFVNLAVCFWIIGNSYWMLCEFVGHHELKYYAGIPFGLGMLSVIWYYYKKVRERN